MMVDFGKIGNIMEKVMDTDYIDIKRDISGRLQEVYSNISCHVAYSSVDNPDPKTVDIKPIIQSITVHCPLWVDLKNNDYIVAKKIGSDGSIVAVYSGRCGNPVVSQGRKKVSMQMDGTEPDEPTPVPPKDGIKITVICLSDGEPLQDNIIYEVKSSSPIDIAAPSIDGYELMESYLDGDLQDGDTVHISEVTAPAEVKFIYGVVKKSPAFRFLVNGLYTRDDGSLASGWHLYRKEAVDSIAIEDDVYTVTCQDVQEVHEDGGQLLKLDVGTRIVLFPDDAFISVSEIVSRENETVVFKAVPFEPTEKERSAYTCEWYG
ncbi:MAG: hypothetical protein II547_09410 [Treponema sp.]|nr:hypothetical protein [Treponema sp.]